MPKIKNTSRKNIVIKKYDNSFYIDERRKKFSNFIFPINTKGRLYFVERYCEKHGNLLIAPILFNRYYKNNELFCDECRLEYANINIPTDDDIKKSIREFSFLYQRGSSAISEKYIREQHLIIYNCILFFTKNINCTWREKSYLFKNELKDIPVCPDCGKICEFSSSNMRYNLYCSEHNINHYRSADENKLYDFIKENYKGLIKRNWRIGGTELDIYIPDLKIAFEYNGLFWHSTYNKNKSYHYDKWLKYKNLGIHVINIWEDDWKYKNEIISSLILIKLNLTHSKIGARMCQIREIPAYESNDFLEKNHIQGKCISKIRIGLFYNDNLVSVMTFSHERKILGNKYKNMDVFELTRFCSKKNYLISGAASKLLKYFLISYNPYKIISYANLDYSIGNLYTKLGFSEKSHSLNYWWAKDRKYHRSNFMRHKIGGNDKKISESEIMNGQGYFKIFGTGSLKYEYIYK